MRVRERIEEGAELQVVRERRAELWRRLDRTLGIVELEVDDDTIARLVAALPPAPLGSARADGGHRTP
jgi:hypothetical protein